MIALIITGLNLSTTGANKIRDLCGTYEKLPDGTCGETCGFHDPNFTLDFRSNRIYSRGHFSLGIVCTLPSTRARPKTGYKSTLSSTRVQPKTGYKSTLLSSRVQPKTGYKSTLLSTRVQPKTGYKSTLRLPSTRVLDQLKTGSKNHEYGNRLQSCSSSRGLRSRGGLKSTWSNKPTTAKEFFVRQS